MCEINQPVHCTAHESVHFTCSLNRFMSSTSPLSFITILPLINPNQIKSVSFFYENNLHGCVTYPTLPCTASPSTTVEMLTPLNPSCPASHEPNRKPQIITNSSVMLCPPDSLLQAAWILFGSVAFSTFPARFHFSALYYMKRRQLFTQLKTGADKLPNQNFFLTVSKLSSLLCRLLLILHNMWSMWRIYGYRSNRVLLESHFEETLWRSVDKFTDTVIAGDLVSVVSADGSGADHPCGDEDKGRGRV